MRPTSARVVVSLIQVASHLAELWTAWPGPGRLAGMKSSDRTKLLFGPYRPPRLRRGDRATCLYKDCDVAITGWTDARISWPRGLPLGTKGHPSLLVDEELARAIRHESAAALRHWWGVSALLVWKWRRVLGVDRLNCPGSQRLIRRASELGASQVRGKKLPPEQVERRRRTAAELDLGRYLRPGCNYGPWWSRREVALLGKLPDDEVAAKVGRTPNAVRIKREKLGVPNPQERNRHRG
jgi:hypothetical protein